MLRTLALLLMDIGKHCFYISYCPWQGPGGGELNRNKPALLLVLNSVALWVPWAVLCGVSLSAIRSAAASLVLSGQGLEEEHFLPPYSDWRVGCPDYRGSPMVLVWRGGG